MLLGTFQQAHQCKPFATPLQLNMRLSLTEQVVLSDLIRPQAVLWCSEAAARQRKQEQSKADMLAANERQMQLKASLTLPQVNFGLSALFC